MAESDVTCWTVIRGAAAGREGDREEFVRRHASVIRAYLCARWRATGLVRELDDAMQEVFLDRFRDEGALTRAAPEVFDRAWANALVRQAAALQAVLARGREAMRRVDILRLRFEEGLPIRDIARRWDADPAHLHHECARARREFRAALQDVVREHHPAEYGDVEAECSRLLACLR